MNWVTVASLEQLPVERAVPARVGSDQVAVVRLSDDSVYAVGNRDPFSGAFVMSRGIVGSTCTDGVTTRTLASPMYKQAFGLATGECISDPAVNLGTWQVRVVDGVVEIGECAISPTEGPENAESV